MFKYLNKRISAPIAVAIVLLLAVLVGGLIFQQYSEIKLPEIKITEKEKKAEEGKEKIVEFTVYLKQSGFSPDVLKEEKIAGCDKGLNEEEMLKYIENKEIKIADCNLLKVIEDKYYVTCFYGCKKEDKIIMADVEWIFNYWGDRNRTCPMMDKENQYRYPNNYDDGEGDYPADTPRSDFYHILSIPFHNSNKILRVYLHLEDEIVRLVVYDKNQKVSNLVKDVAVENGSNYRGIFLPYEMVKDDGKIILRACMGRPGAGGGSVDLGYDVLSFENKQLSWIAGAGAYFYDSFGKIVYVTEGNKTPHYSNPGPSNNAVIYFKNLEQGEERIFFEEQDTSYEITRLDEKLGRLYFKETKYFFSEQCPRKDDSLHCAKKTTTERFVELP